MKYVVIFAAMLLVLQIEMAALMYLNTLNLKVWRAQTELNEALVDAFTNQCLL